MDVNVIKDFLKTDIMKINVAVVGDLMLDRYFYCDVSRISPEAPVPVTLVQRSSDTLGGAANVAHNLVKLGCNAKIFGIIGSDYHGDKLISIMNRFSICSDGVVRDERSTTTKSRIIGGHQQMLRIDFEENVPIEICHSDNMIKKIIRDIENIDAFIISDYKKGVCTEYLIKEIIKIAKKNNKVVFVDPKGTAWDKYFGADFITPNVKEISEIIGNKVSNCVEPLRNAANYIKDRYKIKNVVVTRSEKGISLFLENGSELHVEANAKEVYDVSGAGDTVIAALSAGVAGNLSLSNAARFANTAAGIGVGHVGTYAVTKEEILDSLEV